MARSNSQPDADAVNPTCADASSARRPPRRGRRLIVLLLSLFVGASLIEVGFRCWGPQPLSPRRIEPGVPFRVMSGGRLEYLPNSNFASIYDPAGDARGYFGESGRIDYSINTYGFRGPAPEMSKTEGVVRIACLGDSFTFGEGVRYEDAWPAVLGTELTSIPLEGYNGAESLNAGIQGNGLLDYLMWYGTRIEPLDPDIVVLCFFMNDLMETKETIQINDQMHREAAMTGLGRYSAVMAFFEQRRRAEQLQASLFQSVRKSFNDEGRETLREALSGLEDYSNERGFRLLVVVFPMLWGLDSDYPLVDQHDIVNDACTRAGVEHVDLLNVFQGDRAESLWVHPTDQHPNEIAHRRAAQAIAERLRQPRE